MWLGQVLWVLGLQILQVWGHRAQGLGCTYEMDVEFVSPGVGRPAGPGSLTQVTAHLCSGGHVHEFWGWGILQVPGHMAQEHKLT